MNVFYKVDVCIAEFLKLKRKDQCCWIPTDPTKYILTNDDVRYTYTARSPSHHRHHQHHSRCYFACSSSLQFNIALYNVHATEGSPKKKKRRKYRRLSLFKYVCKRWKTTSFFAFEFLLIKSLCGYAFVNRVLKCVRALYDMVGWYEVKLEHTACVCLFMILNLLNYF